MKQLVFHNRDFLNGEPYTTENAIAEGAGLSRRSVINRINQYLDDLLEFGPVISRLERMESTGRPQKRFYLSEPQASLMIIYLKNTDEAREFKQQLIKQFWEIRNNKKY